MKYLKLYEYYNSDSILIIVDVQKSFSKFFTANYVKELQEYCKKFTSVYQIWDNHSDDNGLDKDYLYDDNPNIPLTDDMYNFPNQKEIIEKRYQYLKDKKGYDFYKNIISKDTYNKMKDLEDNNKMVVGNYFPTTGGTIIVYIGNSHKYFHCPLKLYNLLIESKDKNITLVGGSYPECLFDIEIVCKALGVSINLNKKFIYTAKGSSIK